MTVDEELKQLDENIRRLKIEYDIFFGGGSKRPPNDLDWRVQSGLKRFSDSQKLNFSQRFKFNTIQQKYAIYSDLWRKKVAIKEEGFRRPADALLAIQGVRVEGEELPHSKPVHVNMAEYEPLKIKITNPQAERENIRTLFDALTLARLKSSENSPGPSTFDSFATFVVKKTTEIRSHYRCEKVEYEVEVKDGKVKLKARPTQ